MPHLSLLGHSGGARLIVFVAFALVSGIFGRETITRLICKSIEAKRIRLCTLLNLQLLLKLTWVHEELILVRRAHAFVFIASCVAMVRKGRLLPDGSGLGSLLRR